MKSKTGKISALGLLLGVIFTTYSFQNCSEAVNFKDKPAEVVELPSKALDQTKATIPCDGPTGDFLSGGGNENTIPVSVIGDNRVTLIGFEPGIGKDRFQVNVPDSAARNAFLDKVSDSNDIITYELQIQSNEPSLSSLIQCGRIVSSKSEIKSKNIYNYSCTIDYKNINVDSFDFRIGLFHEDSGQVQTFSNCFRALRQ